MSERSCWSEEQVNARSPAVAPGPPCLLIELAGIEIEMVEHDVTHVGQVDALAEGRGRDDHPQPALAKEPLDLQALAVGHLAVIEHHLVAQLFAQPLGDLRDLRTRVAVDDSLLPLLVALREELGEVAILSLVPRASTTLRFSRTVGSITHDSMRRSSTIRANASSAAVAVNASTCGLPSDRIVSASRA